MIKLSIYGQVQHINQVQYQTQKGHRYDVWKIVIKTEQNDILEFVAREKVIKLVKDVIVGDWCNVTANLVCRFTKKYTFITLDIENFVNTSKYAM